MNTHAQPAPRLVLLLKSGPGSGKKIANQAGYYLHAGHWHKIETHKPVPKGAPIASHPEAAGAITPAKHFSDAEWAHLKLPDTNVNAPTHNKQLAKLKEMSEAGHVTGILGSGYGSNSYGQKLAKIANSLLAQHGSHHSVTPGQKPGEHHAVVAPALPSVGDLDGPLKGTMMGGNLEGKTKEQLEHIAATHPYKMIKEHAKAVLAAKHGPAPDKQDGSPVQVPGAEKVDAVAPAVDVNTPVPAHIKATIDAGSPHFLQSAVANNEKGNPHIAAYAKKVLAEKQATPDTGPKAEPVYSVKKGALGGLGNEGPVVKTGNLDFAAVEKLFGLASGSLDGDDSTTYTITNGQGQTFSVYKHGGSLSVRTSGTNSSHESAEALVDYLKKQAAVKASATPAKFSVGQSVAVHPDVTTEHAGMSGTISEVKNYGTAEKPDFHFKVKLDSGDHEQFQAGELVAASSAADTGPKEGDTKPGADGSTLVLKDGHWTKVAEAAPSIRIKKHPDGTPIKPDGISFVSTNTDIENWIQDGNIAQLDAAIQGLEGLPSIGAQTALAYAQAGINHLKSKKPAPMPAQPTIGDKLASIPWDKQLLPKENSNAASHNKKIAKIIELAFAGDVAGLKAMTFGSNNYAKKQQKLAETAIEALAPTDAEPALVNVTGAASLLMQNKPAYDHLAHTLSAHKMSSPYDKAIATKLAAQDWLAANPMGESEMHAALASLGLSHQAGVIGMQTAAPPAPAGAPVGSSEALNPSTQAMLDDFAANGEWEKVAKVANNSGTPSAKSYAQALLKRQEKANTPDPAPDTGADSNWNFDPSDQAMSGAMTLSAEAPSGHQIVVTKHPDDGTYQIYDLGEEGADGDNYTDYGTLEDLVAGLKSIHGMDVPASLLQKMDPGYKPAAAAAAPAPQTKNVEAKYYENTTGGSSKFWSVSAHGKVMKTVYGKIGTNGTSTEKTFSSVALAALAAEKLTKEKSTKGYSFKGFKEHEYTVDGSAAQPSGPKEGDTKQGADGMLVLKNGHWVKVDQPVKKFTVNQAKDVIAAAFPSNPKIATNKASDAAFAAAKMGSGIGIKNAFILAQQQGLVKTAAKIAALAAAMGVSHHTGMPVGAGATSAPQPAAASAPKPAPAAPVAPSGTESIDGWAKTGAQDGYNDGAFYTDPSGQQWYCKFSAGGEDVAKSEMLALKLYAAAGHATPEMKLISKGGKVGTASKVIAGLKQDKALLQSGDAHSIFSGFAADAWLANWDTVGNNPAAGKGWDNIQFGPDGTAYRIDAGGALAHKGAGGKKSESEWGDNVIEVDTLLNASINANTAKAFQKMTPADIKASVSKVVGISDLTIRALVNQFGPGSIADKQALASKLIARKKSLASKYPETVVKAKKKAPVFDPGKLGSAPDFLNWKGQGQHGPASSEFRNKANQDGVNLLLQIAQKGDISAIQNAKLALIDANTGQKVGECLALEHPSQYVRGFAQQLINEIDFQLNPPKVFRFEGDSPIKALHDAFPVNPDVAGATQKLGKYLILGKSDVFPMGELAQMKKAVWQNGITQETYVSVANKALASIPQLQKDSLKSYTGGGYSSQNGSLWKGNPSGAAKSASEALHVHGHSITPGNVLSRKIDLHGADLDMMVGKDLVSGKPGQEGSGGAVGLILQEPAIQSTSIRPSSWSGNVHLKMTVGPGVKGIYVGTGTHNSDGVGKGGFSNHPGEHEIVLPPNTRMLVKKVLKSPSGGDADGFGSGPHYIVEVLILPNDQE